MEKLIRNHRAKFYLAIMLLGVLLTAVLSWAILSLVRGPYAVMFTVISIVTPVTLLVTELVMTKEYHHF